MLESIRLISASRVSATASGATAVSSVLTEGDGGRAAAGGDGGTHPHRASDAISERMPRLSIHQDMTALHVSQHTRTEGPQASKAAGNQRRILDVILEARRIPTIYLDPLSNTQTRFLRTRRS